MAAPNLANPTTITAKYPSPVALTTSAQALLNNPASSGKALKVNTLMISNVSASPADVTVNRYPEDDIGGTGVAIAYQITVPAKATLVVIAKTNSVYLEEDRSIGALASAGSALVAHWSYEELS